MMAHAPDPAMDGPTEGRRQYPERAASPPEPRTPLRLRLPLLRMTP